MHRSIQLANRVTRRNELRFRISIGLDGYGRSAVIGNIDLDVRGLVPEIEYRRPLGSWAGETALDGAATAGGVAEYEGERYRQWR